MKDGSGRPVSQERLAELSGLHRTYIGHVERREVNVALYNIVRIAVPSMSIRPTWYEDCGRS